MWPVELRRALQNPAKMEMINILQVMLLLRLPPPCEAVVLCHMPYNLPQFDLSNERNFPFLIFMFFALYRWRLLVMHSAPRAEEAEYRCFSPSSRRVGEHEFSHRVRWTVMPILANKLMHPQLFHALSVLYL